MNRVKVNVLTDIPGCAAGQTVMVSVDSDGVPLERAWRRRFTDAKTDNCIEVVEDLKPSLEAVAVEKITPKSKTTGSKNQEKSK